METIDINIQITAKVKNRVETFRLILISIPKAQKKMPADNFERL